MIFSPAFVTQRAIFSVNNARPLVGNAEEIAIAQLAASSYTIQIRVAGIVIPSEMEKDSLVSSLPVLVGELQQVSHQASNGRLTSVLV